MNDIRSKREACEQNIKLAEAEVIRAKAALTALQHACPHPAAKSFRSGDYSGDTYTVFSCPDCGLRTER